MLIVILQFEKITVPSPKELLIRWENGDPFVVPKYVLNGNGEGVLT